MSILSELKNFSSNGEYPMHMPGHKRQVGLLPAYDIDFTEIPGLDDLHQPEGIIREAMDYIASATGAKESFLGVNGATGCLHAAIHAATKIGDEILIARNCHKSVYNACIIRNLKASYIYPKGGIINPEDIEKSLADRTDIKAVVITSPTYDGYVSDIKSIAKICHNHNVALIVDEAHGAHLPYFEKSAEEQNIPKGIFPESAIHWADLVVHSTHKTLPAMTQTALLHLCSDRFSGIEIQKAMSLYETSSPSYVFMASIEESVRYVLSNLKTVTVKHLDYICDFYKYANATIPGLLNNDGAYSLLDDEDVANVLRDPSKIVIDGTKWQMTGKEIYDILKDKFKIVPEMYNSNSCVLITTISDTQDGFDRLKKAIEYIACVCVKQRELAGNNISSDKNSSDFNALPENEAYTTILEGIELESESSYLSLEDIGRELVLGRKVIATEMVIPYPPGFPVIVPGELVNQDVINYIKKNIGAKATIYGYNNGLKVYIRKG